MATSNTASKSGSNKRNLTKITALLLTSAMMVGTGIFTTLGEATSKAQSSILIAMIIGGLIALMTGISAAQAGINYPEEGGAFIWMRIFGHPTVSYTAGISYLMKGIAGLSIAALGFANYSAQLFHGLPVPIAASIALIAVAAVNFFGITPTAKTIIGIFFVNLVLLAIYVSFLAPHVKVSNIKPVFNTGITGILSGAAAFFWAWDGFQRTAIMADKIKDPRKSIPIAIIGGISVAAIIFLVVAGTTLGVLGPSAMGKSDTPLFLAAKTAGWVVWAIVLSAWILAFSDLLGDLMSTSKVGHSMGAEYELPHWLGTVHKKFKSPQNVILLLTLVALVFVNFLPVRRLVSVASAFTLIWYTITHIAAIKLKNKQRFAWSPISWVGMFACVALFLSLPRWSFLGAAGFLALLLGIRWMYIKAKQTAKVDKGGNWSVSGLNLKEGDIITVTAQYAGETVSTETTMIVASAPIQTAEPVILQPITASDTTISGNAPTGASVVLSINGVVQTAITATLENWSATGLTLKQGDIISVTAQSPGETVSAETTVIVSPSEQQTSLPVITLPVTAADKSISGTAPIDSSVELKVNDVAQKSVIAKDGQWTVKDLTLKDGDSISVTAHVAGQTVSTEATTTVAPEPLQTTEPVISGIITAADNMISGLAPAGAKVVLSVNGIPQPPVMAMGDQTVSKKPMVALDTSAQTAKPTISGVVTASDSTVSGVAPVGSSVVLSVNGVAQPSIIAIGGNWMVSGLTLKQGDILSVTAHGIGQSISTATTMTVASPLQTAEPIISGIVTTADTTISGTAPIGASIVLSVNGMAQSPVIANGGYWMVSGLTLKEGDLISVTSQAVGKAMSMAATTKVLEKWMVFGLSPSDQLPATTQSDGETVSKPSELH